jgi:regulatory protein
LFKTSSSKTLSADVSAGRALIDIDQSPAQSLTALDAEQVVIRLLAMRDHSRVELERKLIERDFPQDLIAGCLDELSARGYIDDARFAEHYVRMRIQRGFGPLRIRQELRERGIDNSVLEAHLDCAESSWRKRLDDVATRKFGVLTERSNKELSKRARFLAYRGFPAGLIRDFLFRK